MAELILTDEEKAAKLWTDLDDESLGRLLRRKILLIRGAANQMNRTVSLASALLLTCEAAEANAAELTYTIDGVTQDGREFGDWQVTVKKINKE